MAKTNFYRLLILIISSFFSITFFSINSKNADSSLSPAIKTFHTKWTIVGGGGAGVVTIGILHDCGVAFNDITWVDPEYNGGRLGKYYGNVDSNSRIKDFFAFIKSCKTFQEIPCHELDKLKYLPANSEHQLKIIIKPLLEISNYLRTKVRALQDVLDSLYFDNNVWHVGTFGAEFTSDNVVLATGSYPRVLDYQVNTVIPLDIALDFDNLNKIVTKDDTILVVGSSHSAILLLKYLSQTKAKKIINLYNKPIRYPVEMGNWTLYDNSGLRGLTAVWAKEILEKGLAKNIFRLFNDDENRKKAVKESTKIIYAIGFNRNQLPKLKENPDYKYDESGIIAPRLFGIGIAFPDKYIDPLGNVEHNIGLNSFMQYARKVIPGWLGKKDNTKETLEHLIEFDKLFKITIL